MDSNFLRRKTVRSSGFGIAFWLVCVAFLLGALAFWLIAADCRADIMYSLENGGWAFPCAVCAATLFAAAASIILPAAPFAAVLCTLLGGVAAALLACLSLESKILSADFIKPALIELAFVTVMLYISCSVFKFSPRLRALVRSDDRLSAALTGIYIASVLFLIISSALCFFR